MLREKPVRAVAWSAVLLVVFVAAAHWAGIGWATVDLATLVPGSEVPEATPRRRPAVPGVPTRSPDPEEIEDEQPSVPPGDPREAEGAHAIEDPNGVMRAFYVALHATDSGLPGAVTRIGHYGDSILDADLITGVLRRRLQKRFGDAGHGFVLAGVPWPSYRHWDVKHGRSGFWIVNRSTNSTLPDDMYGIGGVAFRTTAPGSTVWFATDEEGEVGRTASRIEVHYLRQPNGGDMEITGPSGRAVSVSTRAETAAPGFHVVEAPEGPMRVAVTAKGGGELRLFGAALEHAGPGLVYDALNINGARARILLRFDEAHWTECLRHRDLDVVILNFGINESEADQMQMGPYREVVRALVRRVRTAIPESSCLVMGPMDRAGRDSRGRLRTRPIIRNLRDVQREEALAGGCAFWDTFAAMGGDDSSTRWARMGLIGGDYTHVTPRGGVRLADVLYRALLHGYYQGRYSRPTH